MPAKPLAFSDQSAAVSAAAAYGITSQVANTWNPYLQRTPRVLVPIQVDALVLRPGQAPTQWAACGMSSPPYQNVISFISNLDPNFSTNLSNAMQTPQGSSQREAVLQEAQRYAQGASASGYDFNSFAQWIQNGIPPTRRQLLPKPFAELSTPRTQGVYLHWALPDALTAGSADSSTANFPAIPDRWLVLRMFPSTASNQRRSVIGWVLPAADQNPVAVSLATFTDGAPTTESATNPVTALGQGDVSWAAYYDNVQNRLAFYDGLTDIKTGPIAYLVCGWYSNPALDPLGDTSVNSLTDFNNKMAQLGWQLAQGELDEAVNNSRNYLVGSSSIGLKTTVQTAPFNDVVAAPTSAVPYVMSETPPEFPPVDQNGNALGPYTTDGSWWPNATLYHGSVVAIGWPTIGWPGNENGLLSGESGGPPAASSISVVTGNTLTEALAALVAAKSNSPDEARVLEAFLLGILPQLNEANGRPTVDAGLHANSFASMDGGSTTQQLWIPPMPDLPPTLPNPVTPSPGVFSSPPVSYQAQAFQSGQFKASTVPLSGAAKAISYTPLETVRETTFLNGGLREVLTGVTPISEPVQPVAGHYETVQRALPRLFYPSDPVLLIEGAARSFKHGSDDRFSQDNTVTCRLTGFMVTELTCSPLAAQSSRPSIQGQDVLDSGINNGSVPPECESLLYETVLLDPGAAVVLATASQPANTATAQISSIAQNITVEQTVWWNTRNPNFDHAPIATYSGIQGTLPAPQSVTPPVKPWNPLHLDWEIQYIPSTNGIKDWTLGEIDYSTSALPSTDSTTTGITLSGRVHLTGGAAATAADGLQRAINQALAAGGATNLAPNLTPRFYSQAAQTLLASYASMASNVKATITNAGSTIPPVDLGPLQDIVTTLNSMDVLSGALDGFTRALRGGYDPDGKSAPTDGSTPTPFIPLRAGILRILRLRLVDCFGQFLDLLGSSDSSFLNLSQLIVSQPFQTTQAGILAMPPRFTSPSRLWFRFMSADGSENEANDTVSPVCGYLMPNHLDGDLEYFGIDGSNLGDVRSDPQAGIVWEDAPGVPSTVGQTPDSAIPNQFLAGIADGLLQWGQSDVAQKPPYEYALSALLRVIDSTLWAVDPFGHAGDEHMSLLLGHPVVVMRARLRLEVDEPIRPELLATTAIPVRLGAVPDFEDGLLGYFVNDDYTHLYCADASIAGFARAVGPGQGFLQQANLVPGFFATFADDLSGNAAQGATPVTHPYVDTSGILMIRPNQEIQLTLLVEPQTMVHTTTGLLPSKEIGMRRNWIASALAQLSPTFRFGPVLVDPNTIRMPIPTDIQGTWSWDHRGDLTTWDENPVVNATQDALLTPDPASGQEGWLRMTPAPATDSTSSSGSSSSS